MIAELIPRSPSVGSFLVQVIQEGRPGSGERLEDLNAAVAQAMERLAPGLIRIEAFRAGDEGERIMLLEIWESRSAWKAFHAAKPPEAEELFDQYPQLWASAPMVRTWRKIGQAVAR